MQLTTAPSLEYDENTPLVAVFVTDGETLSSTAEDLNAASEGLPALAVSRGKVSADSAGTCMVSGTAGGPHHVLVASPGNRDQDAAEAWRTCGGTIATAARADSARDVTVILPAAGEYAEEPSSIAAWLIEGMTLANYRFEPYKSSKDDDDSPRYQGVEQVTLVSSDTDSLEAARRAHIIAEATNWGRDLANTPGNDMTPEIMAATARELADTHEHLSITILDEEDIQAEKMGLLWGVGKGSAHKPRLIVLEWNPPGCTDSDADRLCFVGKAVTFDTGGISIKPSAGMTNMRMDKAGGCGVIAAMRAIAETDCPHRVLAVVPAAENMPSSTAYKPGDVLTAKDGTTVEITNTDAEGRLILADAITWAREAGCGRIVEMSTLTGAMLSALGFHFAGLIAKPGLDWADEILEAAGRTGDLAWQLPAVPEYRRVLDSKIADIMNSGERWAGSISAGMFLHHFARDTPFAHIDIAGAGMLNKPQRYFRCGGASGYGVRLFTELATTHECA